MARAARRNPGNIQSPDPILPSATLPSKDAGGAPPPPRQEPRSTEQLFPPAFSLLVPGEGPGAAPRLGCGSSPATGQQGDVVAV